MKEIHGLVERTRYRTIEDLMGELPAGIPGVSSSREIAEASREGISREQRKQKAASLADYLQVHSEISKIGVAQIKALPTRIEQNLEKICEYIDKGRQQNVDLLVFPELTIPGYLALDRFDDEVFVAANLAALQKVVEYTEESDMVVQVGFVDAEWEPVSGRLRHFNSMATIQNGKLLAVTDKTLLPDYDIFWETRYFASARDRKPVQANGVSIGAQTCEDVWDDEYDVKPTEELVRNGADLIVNQSASPFYAGKYRKRQDLVAGKAAEYGVPFIYANMVGAQDGYEGEVIFDGRSMIVGPDGALLGLGKSFEEDLLVVDLHHAVEIPLPDWDPLEEIYDALVMGIKDYCSRNGFKKAYIGLSGGIDSAVTAALAVAALGKENVVGVTMPSHITSSETLDDALDLAKRLGIHCEIRPIGKEFEAWEKVALEAHGGKLDDLTRQNKQARIRMSILMEYTNEDRGALLLNTGNKTELALGYCTLQGDMAGGLAVISDVNKRPEVYAICDVINRRFGSEVIPARTRERPPTAELAKGQTDEANLPAGYDVLSPVVSDLVDGGKSPFEILASYPEQVVRESARLIRRAEFKRRQAPPGEKVAPKSFGAGRRFPVDDRFDEFSAENLASFREIYLRAAEDADGNPVRLSSIDVN